MLFLAGDFVLDNVREAIIDFVICICNFTSELSLQPNMLVVDAEKLFSTKETGENGQSS